MAASDERFGVRLTAPPGLGPDGLSEIAQVLAPIAGRPTGELTLKLSEGPLVVNTLIGELEARQLVQTFRTLGAQAELVEAVDLDDGGLPNAGTRPLFARDESSSVDGAWRHVTTGPRAVVQLNPQPNPQLDAGAAPKEPKEPKEPKPPKAHETETRKLSTVDPNIGAPTRPFRPPACRPRRSRRR